MSAMKALITTLIPKKIFGINKDRFSQRVKSVLALRPAFVYTNSNKNKLPMKQPCNSRAINAQLKFELNPKASVANAKVVADAIVVIFLLFISAKYPHRML